MKVLILGFFSTVGDVETLDVVISCLESKNIQYDISAFDKKITFALNRKHFSQLNSEEYTHLIILCGPSFQELYNRHEDLRRFEKCKIIGVNLSLIGYDKDNNPFDVVFPRDERNHAMPDISLLYKKNNVPVIGLCLAPQQNEYGERQQHKLANDLLRNAIKNNNAALVCLDTRWPENRNETYISNPDQFEEVLSRIDVLCTTRLHGLVLALKNLTPVVAIDPIVDGGKVFMQGIILNWPETFKINKINQEDVDNAVSRCLQPHYKSLVQQSLEYGFDHLDSYKEKLLEEIINCKERITKMTLVSKEQIKKKEKLSFLRKIFRKN